MVVLTEMIDDRIRHYSSAGMKLLQVETGKVYDDAVDIVPCPYTYTETDQPVEGDELAAQEALNILMGVDVDG